MGQALHSIECEPDRTIEIVVHITDTLGERRREDLVAALEGNGGITQRPSGRLFYSSKSLLLTGIGHS